MHNSHHFNFKFILKRQHSNSFTLTFSINVQINAYPVYFFRWNRIKFATCFWLETAFVWTRTWIPLWTRDYWLVTFDVVISKFFITEFNIIRRFWQLPCMTIDISKFHKLGGDDQTNCYKSKSEVNIFNHLNHVTWLSQILLGLTFWNCQNLNLNYSWLKFWAYRSISVYKLRIV